MSMEARFVHINIVAHDWQRLARFYEEVFGCQPVPPKRELSGLWLEQATGISGARVRGVHLRLPGYGNAGPTLEIFQYEQEMERPQPAINRPGLAHIALAVTDVKAAREAVIMAGGSPLGEVVSAEIPGAGRVTFAYVSDPEGNFIELQQWE